MYISAFGDAARHFFDRIEEGNCYRVDGGDVKRVRERYRKPTDISHSYEIILDATSSVVRIPDINIRDPEVELTKLSALSSLPKETEFVNILAVLILPEDSFEQKKRNSTDVVLRKNVKVADETGEVWLVFWGQEKIRKMEEHQLSDPVMLVRSAKISRFKENETHLHMWFNSSVRYNPPTPAAERLKDWVLRSRRERVGGTSPRPATSRSSPTSYSSLVDVRSRRSGEEVAVHATIVHVGY